MYTEDTSTVIRNVAKKHILLVVVLVFQLCVCSCSSGVLVNKFGKHISDDERRDIRSKMQRIKIEVEDYVGYDEFAEHMAYLLGKHNSRSADDEFVMNVTMRDSVSCLALQSNTDTVRENMRKDVVYKLYRISDMRLITSGEIYNSLDYSSQFSPYSTYTDAEQAKIYTARYAAENIYSRLMIFFANE
jgi:hypothetical protein